MKNLHKIPELISKTIDLLKLDLTGFTVLTEAASGPYSVTPVIAAMAHAKKVIALTSDSRYASTAEVILQTHQLEKLCKQDTIEIATTRSSKFFAQADIITNLGFVRPLDIKVISHMKSTAVIPYMCEGWEIRSGDVDFDACKKHEIPVLGTNEEYPILNTLSYCGWLCIKMMLDAKIELPHSRILIVSGDKFGPIIKKELVKAGLAVKLSVIQKPIDISQSDVIIIANYTTEDEIIGHYILPKDVNKLKPSIIQFAGKNNLKNLDYDINVYPIKTLSPHRMACTFSELGVKPVIELHALGLKVGESLAYARKERGFGIDESIQYALKNSPGDLIQFSGGYHD